MIPLSPQHAREWWILGLLAPSDRATTDIGREHGSARSQLRRQETRPTRAQPKSTNPVSNASMISPVGLKALLAANPASGRGVEGQPASRLRSSTSIIRAAI